MAITTNTFTWRPQQGFDPPAGVASTAADLVLLFFSGDLAGHWAVPLQEIIQRYPGAIVAGCSSAGEIADQQVSDASITGLAMRFDSTRVRSAMVEIGGRGTDDVARDLAANLPHQDLRYVLVLSDGLAVNGSMLAEVMQAELPPGTVLTGGLDADGPRFEQTSALLNGTVSKNAVVAIGFYGDAIRVAHGSLGGWDPFGPLRTITKSRDNVLYELDNQSALDLYKRYLDGHAARLPASGLLFPLSITRGEGQPELVRTLLAVDESERSMTFAGAIPQGGRARLMKANFDRLVDGASGAAGKTVDQLGCDAEVALLISCVGRKMVLGDRIEEEVEAVREVLGAKPVITGFYSYGELSPIGGGSCELHNQTMTITTFAEA